MNALKPFASYAYLPSSTAILVALSGLLLFALPMLLLETRLYRIRGDVQPRSASNS